MPPINPPIGPNKPPTYVKRPVLAPALTDSFRFLPEAKLKATLVRPAPAAPPKFALPAVRRFWYILLAAS